MDAHFKIVTENIVQYFWIAVKIMNAVNYFYYYWG